MHELKVTSTWDLKYYVCPKVTKMGSLVYHRINFYGSGILRDQWHISSKNLPKFSPDPHSRSAVIS